MNITKRITMVVVALVLSGTLAQAQVAAQKGASIEDLYKRLDELFRAGAEGNKEEILKEAKAAEKHKDEQFAMAAQRIYSMLEETDAAARVEKQILRKFPKGETARGTAYQAIFGEDTDLNLDQKQKAYDKWMKQFPKSRYAENRRNIYANASLAMATAYGSEGNVAKAAQYLNELEGTPLHLRGLTAVAAAYTAAKQPAESLKLWEQANQIASNSTDRNDRGMLPAIQAEYATALLHSGNLQQAEKVASEALTASNYAGAQAENTTYTLVEALTKQNRKLEAFLVIENYIVKNSKKEKAGDLLSKLYQELNGTDHGYTGYVAQLEHKANEAVLAKYKSAMVKNEAPDFSLVNFDGETVTLSSLRGKNVILDFWATWCGPCIRSFPGMQAAVDKYADQDDVEFLFINCWENGTDYEPNVRKFIADNNYRFHVLFDNTNDPTPTKYGVRGIPTKVFIDKEGLIRFQSSGATYDVDESVKEISAKIDLMRAEYKK